MPRRRNRKTKIVRENTSQNPVQEAQKQEMPKGKRILDMQYFLNQLIGLDRHNPTMQCKFADMDVVQEQTRGLSSTFTISCRICGFNKMVYSEKPESDVNTDVIQKAISLGWDCETLNKYLTAQTLPTIDEELFEDLKF